MTNQEQINEFLAASVVNMDATTQRAWDSLSDFERKLIAATAFFFKEGYNQAQRSNDVRKIQQANFWGE